MAQLYDCFAQKKRTSLDEIAKLTTRLDPLITQSEIISSAQATQGAYHRRVIAHDIMAAASVPAFANSAVDGYAFSSAALHGQKPTQLKLVAMIEAGDTTPHKIDAGTEAAIIFTGAPMPQHADIVVMCEDVTENLQTLCAQCEAGETPIITIPTGMKQYDNCRPIGDDIAADTQAIARFSLLGPAELALCHACGRDEIPLLLPLKVGLLSTGDEIVDNVASASSLPWGKLYDSNRPMLTYMLAREQMQVKDYGIIADDREKIKAILDQAAAENDVILTSGGMSEGRKDYIRQLLEQDGQLTFLQAAIKPGRPVGLGTWQGTPIMGMPGNAVASFTVFTMIILPILQKLRGAQHWRLQRFRAVADFDLKKRPHRVECLRAKQTGQDESSLPILQLYGKRGAAIISSLVGADGFAVLDEQVEDVTKGSLIDYVPFWQFF